MFVACLWWLQVDYYGWKMWMVVMGGSSKLKFSSIIIFIFHHKCNQCLLCRIGWACPYYWKDTLEPKSFWALLPTLFNPDFTHLSSEQPASRSIYITLMSSWNWILFVCRVPMRGSIRNYRFCKGDRGYSTLTACTSYVPNSQGNDYLIGLLVPHVHWRGCLKIDCCCCGSWIIQCWKHEVAFQEARSRGLEF